MELNEQGIDGYVEGQCPVQGCGTVDGYPWYFRARWESWSMEIADDKTVDCECLPLVGYSCSGWVVEEDWGAKYEAGYMEEFVAYEFIKKVVELFRAGSLEYVQSKT